MKLSILVFLIIGATLIFFGCSGNNPSAPELSQSDQVTNSLAKPHLTGTSSTLFTFTPPTFWNGTIDFGVDGIYGLTFISYDPPRAYSQASPFEEDFIIYELGTDWTIPENVYLKGWNAGVLNLANSKFVANGEVEVANEPFEMWLGRNVHISGIVNWQSNGLPESAIGTFRIN